MCLIFCWTVGNLKSSGETVTESERRYMSIGLWAVKDWIEMVDKKRSPSPRSRYIGSQIYRGCPAARIVLLVATSWIGTSDRRRKRKHVVRGNTAATGTGSQGSRWERAKRDRGEREGRVDRFEEIPGRSVSFYLLQCFVSFLLFFFVMIFVSRGWKRSCCCYAIF